MAMQRRKRTVKNVRLSDELVWRIKEYITNDQWSPRQISGYVKKSTNMLFMQKLPFGKLSKPLAKVVSPSLTGKIIFHKFSVYFEGFRFDKYLIIRHSVF